MTAHNTPPFIRDVSHYDSDAAYGEPDPAEAAAQTARDDAKRRRSESIQPNQDDDTPPEAA